MGGNQKFKIIHDEVDSGTEVDDPADLEVGKQKYYLRQGSSASLDLADDSVDFVVTDPPYYDSVEYGDLSAFFRVWLRQLAGNGEDENIVWDYKIPHFGGTKNNTSRRSQAYEHYLELMVGIFAECHRVLRKDHGRLVFTFHHWKADGWAALTIALGRAGFMLINRYVVHSENPISVHINKLRALTDDAILVLAPASSGQHRGWSRPAKLSFHSSADFCADCGSMVGWILESGLSEEEIRATWQELLLRK
jgi:adenine-specific DNA methylase